MEQALPIIIALLFFGYKQYKKNIEKNTQHKVEENDYEVESDNGNTDFGLNDFINTFIEETKAVVPQEYKEYYPEEEEESVTFEKEKAEIPSLATEARNTMFDDDKKHHKEKEVQFEMNINKENKGTENTDFDLHQAIIYDIVLNPPYIDK